MAEPNLKSDQSPLARLIGFILLGLLVFTPLHSKVAGGLWFVILLSAIAIAIRHRGSPRINDPVASAAQLWLIYVLITTLLWWSSSVIWGDPWANASADLHSASRLLLTALAGWTILRLPSIIPLQPQTAALITAISMTCLMAYVYSLNTVRSEYPGNAIAWAAAMASLVCILFPAALATTENRRTRLIALMGSAIGLIALLTNQTRGVYGITGWILTLFLFYGPIKRTEMIRYLVATVTVAMLMGATAFIDSDPLRIRETWSDAKATFYERQLNNSVGARIHLYQLSLDPIISHPLIGIGPTARLELINGKHSNQSLVEGVPISAISGLGHVHNAYLHHMLDGGIIALGGFLLTIIGLIHAGFILRRVSAVAAHQMWGIAFVHGTTNITNVNLAHNYYALMLSLSIFLVLLATRRHETIP